MPCESLFVKIAASVAMETLTTVLPIITEIKSFFESCNNSAT